MDTIGDLETGMRRFVVQVFLEEARLGGGRGALTDATRAVAKRYKLKYGSLKKAACRRRDLRFAGVFLYKSRADYPPWVELTRRLSGMPDDVRAHLGNFTAPDMLRLLRELNINGTAPRNFVEAVRAHRRQSYDK